MKRTLLAAVWFGLATGLIEGSGLLTLQHLGYLRGALTFHGASPQIIWIAALSDLLLFGLVGLALILFGRLFPRLPLVRWSAAVFVALMLLDWLAVALSGRISKLAMLILAVGLSAEAARWMIRHDRQTARYLQSSLPGLAGAAVLAMVGVQGGSWLQEQIASARLPESRPDAPNVLVIVVDTLRADHLSSYGYERPTSPNIDRLAEQGVVFDSAFSTSSWTQPSHASLVTGRYTHDHGAELKPLDERFPTIGEVLRAHGYQTTAFSANHSIFNRRQGFGRGFVHFEDHYQTWGDMVTGTVYGCLAERLLHRTLGLEDELGRVRAVHISRHLFTWIDRHRGKPFFAFLNFYDPHSPYLPPEPYRSRFSQMSHPGGMINTYWDMNHIYVPMTSQQLQGEIDAYDGAIAYVDTYIGNLMDGLQKRELLENTLVVITADHGELFGEHGLIEHTNSLYCEVLHVPLIVWWPGHTPVGEHVAVPVTNAALPATILDMIGGDQRSPFPGPSLARLWEMPADGQSWPAPLAELAQIPWAPAQHLSAKGAMKSIIDSRWHFIEYETLGSELYDWQADPHEMENLVERTEVQSIRNELQSALAEIPYSR